MLRSWVATISPLFIFKGFLVLFPIALTIFGIKASYVTRDRSRWSKEAGVLCLITVFIALLVLGPLLILEIFLAQHADGKIYNG